MMKQKSSMLGGIKNNRTLPKRIFANWELYLFVLPVIVYLIIFHYVPMYGIIIAFKDFRPARGIIGSQWAGLKHFIRFFSTHSFSVILKNTLVLSIYSLIAGFPLPIILALVLNICPFNKLKKIVQTVTYAPHFISIIVIVGMINVFFAPSFGIVGNLLRKINLLDGPFMILSSEKAFPHLYVWSGIWQGLGWSSIIYLGALSGVDPELHESAVIDGANKIARIIYIDIPAIVPTIVVLLILNFGSIMNVGFEKVFLMQNSMNISTSEVINTYIYKIGIREGQWSFSTAIGLFNSLVNFVMLTIVNKLAKLLGDTALW